MPSNIVIVGMSTYPLNLQMIDERTQLLLPKGPVEISYFFGVSQVPPTQTPNSEQNFDNTIYFFGGGIVAAAAAMVAIFMKRSKIKRITQNTTDISLLQDPINEKPLDVETIFELRPELRDDDKQLVSFLSSNGGQAYESELRKKFLQPRTTMWRAVKRLERYGIVEIDKKELQNLVRLKKKLEDENL